MLKGEQPSTRTLGIAADAPVVFAAAGWSESVPGREFHPLKSSAFYGALYRQLSYTSIPVAKEPSEVLRWQASEMYAQSRSSVCISGSSAVGMH